jgi:hypothetical protein
MRTLDRRNLLRAGVVFIVLASPLLIGSSPSLVAADTLPSQLSDEAFWRMISDFSEGGGSFRFEFMSNEREFQTVIPDLIDTTKPGGVYLGVGPEQNFTYIAAIQPKIAFITDIRRENMLEHLIYKAIFEMSSTRVDFISRLFSRKPPAGLTASSTVRAMFQAYRAAEPDRELFMRNLEAIKDRLKKLHHFELKAEDEASIEYIYRAIFSAADAFSYSTGGFGGFRGATYSDLMIATDKRGVARSYLATEEGFRFVREMEQKNLIVPFVGDFAGPKTLRRIGQFVKDHGATVTAFYTSNVEQYLFQQGDEWRRFLSNVGTFPLDASSTFIRSSHFAYSSGSVQPTRQLTGGNFVQLLCPMADLVRNFNQGRIQDYDDVIRKSRQ